MGKRITAKDIDALQGILADDSGTNMCEELVEEHREEVRRDEEKLKRWINRSDQSDL